MFRWKPVPDPDEQVFETIKAAIDSAGPDAKAFLNSGTLSFVS